MNRKNLAITSSVVAVVIAAVIVLLATGGDDPDEITEGPLTGGEVEVGDGPSPPEQTELANIIETEVTADGSDIVFEAQVGAEIPRRLEEGTLDFRWEIIESGNPTYIVSANLDVGPNASVISQDADSRFGASTIDDSFPGGVAIQGDRVIIRLDPSDVPDFPREFSWFLQTTLDGVAGDPASGLATDRAPQEGVASFASGE